jgi:hypothetical protein
MTPEPTGLTVSSTDGRSFRVVAPRRPDSTSATI